DPAADIGDIYAWMSPDGRRLNLVMTIVGRRFSDRLQYVFHVDSGPCFGETTATTSIVCRFDAAGAVDCRAGAADSARGDAGAAAGPARRAGGRAGNPRRFRRVGRPSGRPFLQHGEGGAGGAGDGNRRAARRGSPRCLRMPGLRSGDGADDPRSPATLRGWAG